MTKSEKSKRGFLSRQILLPSFSLSFCFSFFCLFVFLSFCLYCIFCLSVFLPLCLSVFLPFYLSAFLSFCLSVLLYVTPSSASHLTKTHEAKFLKFFFLKNRLFFCEKIWTDRLKISRQETALSICCLLKKFWPKT
jgi:hypothetical protein